MGTDVIGASLQRLSNLESYVRRYSSGDPEVLSWRVSTIYPRAQLKYRGMRLFLFEIPGSSFAVFKITVHRTENRHYDTRV